MREAGALQAELVDHLNDHASAHSPDVCRRSATAPADLSAATTYTDVNGLAALKRDPNSPQAINAVAQQVEALFLQMMLKSMRDADSRRGNRQQ